jgi:hypothetical protein
MVWFNNILLTKLKPPPASLMALVEIDIKQTQVYSRGTMGAKSCALR